ncbi:MAG: hypothetical protein HY656_05755 [Acidobacteria bacterium]|nr:hypothetical protein [Acidobacteriota bacterium]
MSTTDKAEMARRLRAEAEDIRRHGLTNFFEHTYACLRYGQASKERAEDRCGICPMRPFVPADVQEEAFPCQHINEEGWDLASQQADLAEKYVAWLLKTAEQLEAEAAGRR